MTASPQAQGRVIHAAMNVTAGEMFSGTVRFVGQTCGFYHAFRHAPASLTFVVRLCATLVHWFLPYVPEPIVKWSLHLMVVRGACTLVFIVRTATNR